MRAHFSDPTYSQRTEVAILANPHSGRASSRKKLDEFVAAVRSFGFSPLICWTLDELREVVAKRGDMLRCVVAAGGDGTFNALLNQQPTLPLAVLPLGNENLVAKHFGFVRSGQHLARAIADGRFEVIDLGSANQTRFALMAGAGFDADVVHRVHHHRRGHVSKRTYAWQIMQAARVYSFPSIRVNITETGELLNGSMVFLFNLPRYGLGIPIAPRADPADGRLDLYVFERRGISNLLRYATAVALRSHDRLPDVHFRRVRHVTLQCDQPVPLQVDGDPAGHLPVTIDVAPDAVKILKPAR